VKKLPLSVTLALSELKTRYEESTLGFIWAFLNPLLLIGIYAVFFGKVFGSSAGSVPFSLHLFSGYLAWDLFGRTVGESHDIFLSNKAILTKVKLPLDSVFHARVLYHLFHFVFAAAILIAAMLFMGLMPGWQLLFLPIVFVSLALFTAGSAMIVGIFALFLKDLREVVPVVLLAWLFATPIFYDESMLNLTPGSSTYYLYRCNPMYWFIEYTRECTVRPEGPHLLGYSLLLLGSLAVYKLGHVLMKRSRSLVLDVL